MSDDVEMKGADAPVRKWVSDENMQTIRTLPFAYYTDAEWENWAKTQITIDEDHIPDEKPDGAFQSILAIRIWPGVDLDVEYRDEVHDRFRLIMNEVMASETPTLVMETYSFIYAGILAFEEISVCMGETETPADGLWFSMFLYYNNPVFANLKHDEELTNALDDVSRYFTEANVKYNMERLNKIN